MAQCDLYLWTNIFAFILQSFILFWSLSVLLFFTYTFLVPPEPFRVFLYPSYTLKRCTMSWHSWITACFLEHHKDDICESLNAGRVTSTGLLGALCILTMCSTTLIQILSRGLGRKHRWNFGRCGLLGLSENFRIRTSMCFLLEKRKLLKIHWQYFALYWSQ